VSAEDLCAVAEDMLKPLKDIVSSAQELKQNGDEVLQKGEMVALLANAIAAAEGDAKWKDTALAVRDTAMTLAKAGKAKNHSNATKAFEEIQQLISEGTPNGGERIEMKPLEISSLHHVMEEVQSRYGSLRRRIRRPARFARAKDSVARDGQMLALLAAVIRTDTVTAKEVMKPQTDFEQKSDAMVKAAKALATAAKEGDQKATDKARKALQKSCSRCHSVYRPDA
jgi:uncharacterized protein YoaH (UPF0181 family)